MSQSKSFYSNTVAANDITGRNHSPLHQRITAVWLVDKPCQYSARAPKAEPRIVGSWDKWEPDLAIYIADLKTRANKSKHQGRKWIIEKDGQFKGFESTVELARFFGMSDDAIFSRFSHHGYPESIEIKGFRVCSIN